MLATTFGFSALLLSVVTQLSVASPFSPRALTDTDLAKIALDNAYKVLNGTIKDGSDHSACTKENVAVRKEYGDMTTAERDAYVEAVKCIRTIPSKFAPGLYPGAKTRFDDFVVVHMNMTPGVHGTANFMHWHRYYVWAYETALRDECGYKGYQPYWNWGKYPDLTKSPIFNGDAHSMGGNGDYIPHKGVVLGQNGITVPAGNGGGCVTTGPFGNLTVNLGPLMKTLDPSIQIKANPQADGYGYNPRCLRRDVNNYFTSKYITPAAIATHLQSTNDILPFQDTLQGDTQTGFCLHTGGHYSIWGDPGGDVYVSPSEPTFWFHHGQLDRHWWIWQMQDPPNRVQQYKGGTVWLTPNSPAGKITDVQQLNVVLPQGIAPQPSKNLVSTTAGPFCYVYV